MARLRLHNFTLSLDGYAAGPNQGVDQPARRERAPSARLNLQDRLVPVATGGAIRVGKPTDVTDLTRHTPSGDDTFHKATGEGG